MLSDLLYRLRSIFRRRSMEQDLDDELRFHLEQQAERLAGRVDTNREEAWRRARVAMGGVEQIKEACRDSRGVALWDNVRQDLAYAFRQLRKRPLQTTAAVLTLALGAGMNLALFRVVWGVLLKPLPYSHPEELVHITLSPRSADGSFRPRDRRGPDNYVFEKWRARVRSFDGLAFYRSWRSTVTAEDGEPRRLPTGMISAEFFSVLGIPLLAGRAFRPDEIRIGSDNVVILSHGYWSRHGASSSALGSSIYIDGRPHRVIGILPPTYHGTILSATDEPELYLPISKMFTGALRIATGQTVARLRPGTDLRSLTAELAALNAEGTREQGFRSWSPEVEILKVSEEVGRSLRPSLWALFGATGCVLLIACANIANLLLAQAVARRQEMALRAALGATRGRLVRQLFTESVVLAMLGSAVGLMIAVAMDHGLLALYGSAIPRLEEGQSGAVIAAFGLLITVGTAVAFGTLPAFLASGERRRKQAEPAPALHDVLRTGGRGGVPVSAARWRHGLVAVQIGVTLMVLVAAGLLLKSFMALRGIDLGFERDRVLTAQVALPDANYGTKESNQKFTEDWVQRLESIPGVESAAVTNSLPLAYNVLLSLLITIPGHPGEQGVGARMVTSNYFSALGLQTLAGRPLEPRDSGRQDIAVINEAFARRFFPKGDAVGSLLGAGRDVQPLIVGIVKDVRDTGISVQPEPVMYVPFGLRSTNLLDTIVRTRVDPESIISQARAELRRMDPGLALAQVSTMEKVVEKNFARPRFQAALMALFGLVALLLATIGVYAVVSQSVRARTAEFGIRLALGATPGGIFRLVVGQGMRAPLLGFVCGLLGAFAGGRVLESLLYGVESRDTVVLLSAAGLLLAVALLACALSATEAARTEPTQALRAD